MATTMSGHFPVNMANSKLGNRSQHGRHKAEVEIQAAFLVELEVLTNSLAKSTTSTRDDK